jgi:sirohydrochlorin ferrochelatase
LAALEAKCATEIVAFPYFLAAGTHPAVKVRLTPHLGASAVFRRHP